MNKKLVYKKCSEYNSIGTSVNITKFVTTKSDDMVYWYPIKKVD